MSLRWPEFVYPWYDQLGRFKSLLTRRGYPLHRSENYRPFFIVGSGRCGTTLLRRILQASPDIHIPPETYMIGPAVRFFRRNRDRPWKHLVRHVMAMFEFHPEFDPYRISLRPLVQDLNQVPEEQRSLALMLDRLFHYHGNETRQTFTRWGDKTPLNAYYLDEILETFPDARIVHLIRDGIDVVHSLLEANLLTDLHTAAKRWITAIAAVESFSTRYPERCVITRYEHLVAHPQIVAERVCTFLDISFEKHMIDAIEHGDKMKDLAKYGHHENVFQPISASHVGKGRRALSDENKIHLHRLIGAELERLGYDPVV